MFPTTSHDGVVNYRVVLLGEDQSPQVREIFENHIKRSLTPCKNLDFIQETKNVLLYILEKIVLYILKIMYSIFWKNSHTQITRTIKKNVATKQI